jgi:hypothetical protein
MLRDVIIALSLSNLCFISAWRGLLLPSSFFYYYHRETLPPLVEYIALILVVLLLAALFLLGITAIRRFRSERVIKCARVAFVLILTAPLYGLLVQIDNHSIRQLMGPLISDEAVVERLFASIPLTICVFVLLVALWRIKKAVRMAITLILILAPFVLITFSQAALTAMKYRHVGTENSALALERGAAASRPRVLWLVFDELDFRLTFGERPPTVDLHELDRLANESLFANHAYPPAGETFLAMPALTTGRLVSEARRRGPDELMIKFGGNTEAAPWSAQPNIFSRAREAGFNTALVGWYHPYCRIIGNNLTRCAWAGAESFTKLSQDPATLSQSPGAQGLVAHMNRHVRTAALTIPLASIISLQSVDVGQVMGRKHISDFNSIYRQAIEAATNPDLGVVMVHWPIPHCPNIYDRAEDRISISADQSYLDNLELVDRTMGDIRRAMESNGTWEKTVVLVTSDHWWRNSHWKKHRRWTAEDEAASVGTEDRRIPFILKMAGPSKEGAAFAEPFNTILTHDLLLAILRGQVMDTKGAAAWLDRHRSIGRSPYDDRTFR